MSFSSWVQNRDYIYYGALTLWFWITILTGIIRTVFKIFVFLPWWLFLINSIYFLLLGRKNKWHNVIGTISKVYAPFNILVYWIAIYPTHDPWNNSTDTYLVVMAHIIAPFILIMETIRKKNTHYSQFKQRNFDFMPVHSYWITSILYWLYFLFYLAIIPSYHDPIYVEIGFTQDSSRDFLLAFLGWIIVLLINTVLTVLTWYWREKERQIISESFDEHDQALVIPQINL